MLHYYFLIQFAWKKTWYSQTGLKKPVIRASELVLRKEYVDYSILESFFLDNETQKYNSANLLFSTIKLNVSKDKKAYFGSELGSGIEFKPDFCKLIDTLGTDDGIDGPLNWNIKTPEHLQFIPTIEIFQLFDDWLDFLKAVEYNAPKFVLT